MHWEKLSNPPYGILFFLPFHCGGCKSGWHEPESQWPENAQEKQSKGLMKGTYKQIPPCTERSRSTTIWLSICCSMLFGNGHWEMLKDSSNSRIHQNQMLVALKIKIANKSAPLCIGSQSAQRALSSIYLKAIFSVVQLLSVELWSYSNWPTFWPYIAITELLSAELWFYSN